VQKDGFFCPPLTLTPQLKRKKNAQNHFEQCSSRSKKKEKRKKKEEGRKKEKEEGTA
jgi:hypothetical protein